MFFLGSPARQHLWALAQTAFYSAEREAENSGERLLSGPTVDFYVGPDKRHWSLHRNLLCHHSSYFETEFLGNEVPKSKKGGDNGKLELPDDDPAGFELLVKWMYQGKLEDVSDMAEEKKYDYAVACHKLYMLCHRFDMPVLKNTAIDQYRKGLLETQLVPDAEEIDEIYRRSPVNSPFRKLMVKIAARQIMDPDSEKDAESYRKCFDNNPDFAVEMVNAIRIGSGGVLFDDPTDGNECDYHDHTDGATCHNKDKGKESTPPPSSQPVRHAQTASTESSAPLTRPDAATERTEKMAELEVQEPQQGQERQQEQQQQQQQQQQQTNKEKTTQGAAQAAAALANARRPLSKTKTFDSAEFGYCA
ncbi:hypothetical protein LTR28_001231 [Elasticomyces elasticus]|nr:hypothetical protein LTR28_001231 [Elasticomyces elasticus]